LGSPESSQANPDLLELAVFPGNQAWEGALIEDDGWSQGYREGKLARTGLRQSAWNGRYGTVTIDARTGDLASTLGQRRDIVLRIASAQKSMLAVVDEQEVEVVQDGGFWVLELPLRPTDMPTVVNFR
jgi:hypothetical protein